MVVQTTIVKGRSVRDKRRAVRCSCYDDGP
jgi:hypothetical protein